MDAEEKCSKPQEGAASPHGNTKETSNERIDLQPDLRSSHATASAKQNTGMITNITLDRTEEKSEEKSSSAVLSTKTSAQKERPESKLQQVKSVGPKASTNHHNANTKKSFVEEERDWSCSRCTYLNPPGHTICAMCATTRGFGPVELTWDRSRICRQCTYHNKENATVCRACHKTLDLQNPETHV